MAQAIQRRNREACDRCPLHQASKRFLRTLTCYTEPRLDADQFEEAYFEPDYDHCYCNACDPLVPDVLKNVGGTDYEIPKGWCGFGLKIRPGAAESLKIFEQWPVTYHGCKASNLTSILREGSLLMPGDKLIDGSILRNAHTGGDDPDSRLRIWTSPSV